LNPDSSDLRGKIAKEAANLLYLRLEKEYKQAKLKAAHNFGTRVLPSNLEVALELDKIAEENEGPARNERLVQMRIEALKIMKILKAYGPVLIGSVWRGTIRIGSDVDITLYSDDSEEIVACLKANEIKISKTERMTLAKHGKIEASFHIHAETSNKLNVEISVRNSEEEGRKRQCETFGDEIKGLKIRELEKLLKSNPTRRFIPS
jgi:predicted nucleotidyltransferase